MAVSVLSDKLVFPPVREAEPDGLLAIGGDLSVPRLLLAYRQGIFPWYEGDYILWWSPDPRFVLFPEELRVSRSMRTLLRRTAWRFTVNQAFSQVIRACRTVPRAGQDGTWITGEMEQAYIQLHELGIAHSAEVWQEDQLVGGLYGLRLGRVFFGESMFSLRANASKLAFVRYVHQLQAEQVALIDCQVYTAHLDSLGARMIARSRFLELLRELTGEAESARGRSGH
ncbi:MAG TPA: leucyl/phenylalanyl-tRNA--protein transferase [Chitinophagaceae bacterium]|nr:leucyl/phenylalanyl-tRNA--protein transferase [Chitinophagaceae bacterium]